MDYRRFLELRAPIWDQFERRLERMRERRPRLDHAELEALAFEYRQVLHDHALAGSRYAGTGAARRLSRLALSGTHALHRDEADRLGGLRHFFGRAFPRAFRRLLPQTGVASALFATSLLLGLSLCVAQPRVGAALLGPLAVDGLEHGRLWTEALVTTVPPSVSSSAIATNNMSVALLAWAGGALAGAGALYVVLMNGFLLGAILAATWHYSMADELLGFVAAHGPLEISLILVSSGAGLAMGHALVTASDRPRREALRDASRDALTVLVGSLPWFLVLGVVEGVISPAPDVSSTLKLALGLFLETFYLLLAWNPLLERRA